MVTRAFVILHDRQRNVVSRLLLLNRGDPRDGGIAMGRALLRSHSEDLQVMLQDIMGEFQEFKLSPAIYDIEDGYVWEYHVSPTEYWVKNMARPNITVFEGQLDAFIAFCETA